MTETKKILYTVGAVLVDAEKRVLIQQRPAGGSYAGFWELPGGKIDPGEIPQAALARELEEELGIVLREETFFPLIFFSGPYPGLHVINLIFGCREWEGVPQSREGQVLKWVMPLDLANYDLLDKCQPIIEVLRKMQSE